LVGVELLGLEVAAVGYVAVHLLEEDQIPALELSDERRDLAGLGQYLLQDSARWRPPATPPPDTLIPRRSSSSRRRPGSVGR
jgi:hypothetical protein